MPRQGLLFLSSAPLLAGAFSSGAVGPAERALAYAQNVVAQAARHSAGESVGRRLTENTCEFYGRGVCAPSVAWENDLFVGASPAMQDAKEASQRCRPHDTRAECEADSGCVWNSERATCGVHWPASVVMSTFQGDCGWASGLIPGVSCGQRLAHESDCSSENMCEAGTQVVARFGENRCRSEPKCNSVSMASALCPAGFSNTDVAACLQRAEAEAVSCVRDGCPLLVDYAQGFFDHFQRCANIAEGAECRSSDHCAWTASFGTPPSAVPGRCSFDTFFALPSACPLRRLNMKTQACALDSEEDCALNSECEWVSQRDCPNGENFTAIEGMICVPTSSAQASALTAAPGSDGEVTLQHSNMRAFCMQAEDAAACAGLSEATISLASREGQRFAPGVVLSLLVAAVSRTNS